jgi:two-component system sensor histidine kinase RegB
MKLPNRFSTVPVIGMLRRLFILRLYAITGQLLVILGVNYGLQIALPLLPMLAVIALSGLLNLVTWVRLQQPWPATTLEFMAHLLVDVMALTVLLFYSGGSTNPFVSLYLLPIIIAAISLPALYAWGLTLLSVAAYSLLLLVYLPLNMPQNDMAFNLHVVGMWINFIVSAVLIAYFVSRMAESIRSRDQALAQARENNLRNEQIVALGSLAAGAAHELSTPLATMAIVTGELQREQGDNPAWADSLQILRQQLAACKAILTQLTAEGGAARAEGGHLLAVDTYLDGLVGRWQLLRPGTLLTTHWDGARPAPQVLADTTLDQALLNLFNNAADSGSASVDLLANWHGTLLQLDILDRGRGFDQAALQRAGEVFFTTRQTEGGLGLGLFLANATLERLGGSVRMLPRPGGGTQVAVSLPLHGQMGS